MINDLYCNINFASFQSLRAQIAWATNSEPHISCSVASHTQITQGRFRRKSLTFIKKINAIVDHLKCYLHIDLHFPWIQKSLLKLQVFSDASFATNRIKRLKFKFPYSLRIILKDSNQFIGPPSNPNVLYALYFEVRLCLFPILLILLTFANMI